MCCRICLIDRIESDHGRMRSHMQHTLARMRFVKFCGHGVCERDAFCHGASRVFCYLLMSCQLCV